MKSHVTFGPQKLIKRQHGKGPVTCQFNCLISLYITNTKHISSSSITTNTLLDLWSPEPNPLFSQLHHIFLYVFFNLAMTSDKALVRVSPSTSVTVLINQFVPTSSKPFWSLLTSFGKFSWIIKLYGNMTLTRPQLT